MSGLLTSAQLTALRAWVVANDLPDTCRIGNYADGGTDETGKPIQTWNYGAVVACRFREPIASEIEAFGQVAKLDGLICLPLSTAIEKRDRIHLLTRWGATYDLVFEIIGDPVVDELQLIVRVSKVTNTGKR